MKFNLSLLMLPMLIFPFQYDFEIDTRYTEYFPLYDEALWIYLESSDSLLVDKASVKEIRGNLAIARTIVAWEAQYPIQPPWHLHTTVIKLEDTLNIWVELPEAIRNAQKEFGLTLDSVSIEASGWDYIENKPIDELPLSLYHFTVPDSLNERIVSKLIANYDGVLDATPHLILWNGGTHDIEMKTEGNQTLFFFHMHYCMSERIQGVWIRVEDGDPILIERVHAFSRFERFRQRVKGFFKRIF